MQKTAAAVPAFDPEAPAVKAYLSHLRSPLKMRLFFLSKLPSLFFWGARVGACSPYGASVSVPFRWATQNPFRSTYFAALAGAAELSTGILCLLAIEGRGRISMLITGMQATYIKKATDRVTFTCEEGQKIIDAVQNAIDQGQGQAATVTTTGTMPDGTVVARMQFTWSFKAKSDQ